MSRSCCHPHKINLRTNVANSGSNIRCTFPSCTEFALEESRVCHLPHKCKHHPEILAYRGDRCRRCLCPKTLKETGNRACGGFNFWNGCYLENDCGMHCRWLVNGDECNNAKNPFPRDCGKHCLASLPNGQRCGRPKSNMQVDCGQHGNPTSRESFAVC